MGLRSGGRAVSGRISIPREPTEKLAALAPEQIEAITAWFRGLDYARLSGDLAATAAADLGVPVDALRLAFSLLNVVLLDQHREEMGDADLRAEMAAAELSDAAVEVVQRLVAGCVDRAEALNRGARTREYSTAGLSSVEDVEVVCDLRAVVDQDAADALVGNAPAPRAGLLGWVPVVIMGVTVHESPDNHPKVSFQFTEEEFRNFARKIERIVSQLDTIASEGAGK